MLFARRHDLCRRVFCDKMRYREGCCLEIKTERLTLRPLSLEYLDSTHAYASDLENTRFMMFLPNASRGETEAFIREAVSERAKPEPAYYEFAVLLGNAQIGGISLYFLQDRREAELGWILDKRHWGHGYAAEAARGLMDWGRQQWGIRRFIAQCDAENAPSWRLMERLGMRRIGCAGGRKNRSSDEERTELTYVIEY